MWSLFAFFSSRLKCFSSVWEKYKYFSFLFHLSFVFRLITSVIITFSAGFSRSFLFFFFLLFSLFVCGFLFDFHSFPHSKYFLSRFSVPFPPSSILFGGLLLLLLLLLLSILNFYKLERFTNKSLNQKCSSTSETARNICIVFRNKVLYFKKLQ